MTERKFHKQTIVFEVLSEDPLSGYETLNDLFHMTTTGDCSGRTISSTHEEIDGKTAADTLYEHGSEPEFFRLNDEGDDKNR